MELFRRFISYVNKTDSIITSNESIPGYYLGKTFAAQASSDELHRAAYILTTKTKKDIEKNTLPILLCCFEEAFVIFKDARLHHCIDFDVRKIVVSCVDAKNQRLLAIFYHNEGSFLSSNMPSRGLECHLFLCRNKEVARFAANRIGELLAKQYNQPRMSNVNLDAQQVRLSKATPNDDYDYENISKFFRQKVFRENYDYMNSSIITTPCDSLSTCNTTNGCDSGCASTVASMDLRSFLNRCGNDALNADNETSILESSKKIQNRDSVHYDFEDEHTSDLRSGQNHNVFNVTSYSLEVSGEELQRLLELTETDI